MDKPRKFRCQACDIIWTEDQTRIIDGTPVCGDVSCGSNVVEVSKETKETYPKGF